MNVLVRQASSADLEAAARVLAAAFDDYPWTRWAIPEDGYLGRLERLQHLYLGHALENGVVLVDDEVRAVAAFLPPDVPALSQERQKRVAELHGSRLSALAAVVLPEPPRRSWSLATLGVHPARQGAGLGSALITAGLALADRDAAPGGVALETSDERNVRLYRRSGFTVTAETPIADGPTVYSMSRPPRTP